MPVYSYFCPQCGIHYSIYKRLADYQRPEACGQCPDAPQLTSYIVPPAVVGDYPPYDCPITGKRIEGRRAHEENLRRHGCRVLEPGETEAFRRGQEQAEATFDRAVDATVEEFIEKLPSDKKERLANEVATGFDVIVERR